jgi:transcriptional regulator with XRE-family HTH domain
MSLREILARNVRRRRRTLGVSQEELAHRAGVDRSYVSHVERCVYAATVDVIEQLAVAMDIEPAELLRK